MIEEQKPPLRKTRVVRLCFLGNKYLTIKI
jgi:hypothetical protein